MTRKMGTRELLPQLLTPGLWHLRQYPGDWNLLPHLLALGTPGPCSLQSRGAGPRAVGRASYGLCVAQWKMEMLISKMQCKMKIPPVQND